MSDIQDQIFGMSSAAREVLEQLFVSGPRLDGDVGSKAGRSDLVERGLCERWNGWNWLTRTGVQFAVDVMLMERKKDRYLEERRNAVHAMRHPEEQENKMSDFGALSYNPRTHRVEMAAHRDNHFGPHKYGISFAGDDKVYTPDETGIAAAGKEIDRLWALLGSPRK